MRKIFITGVSGTGKTTIAEELKKSVRIIDVDCVPGLCSWVNNETGKEVDGANTANADNTFIDEHDYVCNIEKLEKTMNESDDLVVVFGSVGNNSKLLPLFDKVLLLQCPPEVLTERLRTRTTNDFGKDTAVQERILGWRIAFDKLMLDAGAIPVDATRPLEKVVAQVLEEIRS